MRKLCIILAFLLLLVVSGCTVRINGEEITSLDLSFDSGPSVEKTEVQDVTMESQDSITVTNTRGQINLASWDKNSIQVTAVKKVRANKDEKKLQEYLDKMKVEVTKDSGSVEVEVKYVQEILSSSNQRVDLQIMVPAAMKKVSGSSTSGSISIRDLKTMDAMKLKSTSGSVEVDGITSKDIDIETTSGSIHVNDTEGAASLHSVSGSIEMEGLKGDLKCKTTSGSIHGNSLNGEFDGSSVSGRIEADTDYLKASSSMHTVSGSIHINAEKIDTSGQYKLDSTSGSVEMNLPDQAGFKLDASSVSGSVSCGLNMADKQESKRHKSLSGTVGAGGPEITIRTVSGSIHING